MRAFIGALAAILSGCAATSVTPISQNQFLLSTSAAPACGKAGAARVASKMAAVETIRRGYQRFLILGAGSQNNVSVISSGPTYSTTNATMTSFGNTSYGSARTTYGGATPIFVGTHDRDLQVMMLKPGDRGFSQGVDAKSQLGEKWEELVSKGIHTCAE